MTFPIQTQLASISPYLIRVWHYINATQTWIFYDPNDLAGSILQRLVDGNLYYISVNTSCTIQYNEGNNVYSFQLDAVNPNQNLVVWVPTSQGQPKAFIWETSLIPAIILANTYALINVGLMNTGSGSGVLSSGIYATDPDLALWESGNTIPIQPGGIGNVLVGFTMPSHDIVFCLIARHKDSSGNWVLDQVQAATYISVGASSSGPTHPVLISTPSVPASASKGDLISIPLNIKNDGGTWGALQARVRSSNIDTSTLTQDPLWLELYPYPMNGNEGIQTLGFTMPDSDVSFYVELYHWNYDTGQWIKDSESGPYSIQKVSSAIDISILSVSTTVT